MPSCSVSIEIVANIFLGISKAVFLESNPVSCSVIYVVCLAMARSVSKTVITNRCTQIQSNSRKELGSLGWSNSSLNDLGISVTTDQDQTVLHIIGPACDLILNETWLGCTSYQGLFVQGTAQTNNLNKQFFNSEFTIHTSNPEARSGYKESKQGGFKNRWGGS